jgi:CRISPR system Cascade subunit CasC
LALKKLLEVSATVSPTGKQNSFASRAYSSYIMIEKGSRQPRTLSSAFLKPIYGDDLLGKAIESFKVTQANMNKVFGKCYDECYEMNVNSGTGSMEEAGAFLDRM